MHPFLAFYLWSAMLPHFLTGGADTSIAAGHTHPKAAGE